MALCPHPKTQGSLGLLQEETSPPHTSRCCTSSVLLPQPPLQRHGQKHRVCRPWGNSCHRFSLSFSLVLASALYRDKGRGGAPCLEVTLTAPATVLWLVPGEPVPTPVPQPGGLSARKEAERKG